MEHENFDDVLREDWPDEERTTNLDEPAQETHPDAQRQAQGQSGAITDEPPAPPQTMPDPRIDDNAGRPPTPSDV